MAHRTKFAHLVLLALASLAARAAPETASAAATETAADTAAPTVNAVWVEHKLQFTYFGQTTYYSCDGIREKVRYLLKEAGARDDMKVQVSCFEPVGVERMPTVRIRAAVPTEATPEVLAKLAQDGSKRELVSRVQGKGGTDDVTAQFPAVWRKVEIEGRRSNRIEEGDCELVDQMLDAVLVPMGVKLAPDSRASCVPHQVTTGSVKLNFEALHRAPTPDEAPGRTEPPDKTDETAARTGDTVTQP
jgi:hypothetical protein